MLFLYGKHIKPWMTKLLELDTSNFIKPKFGYESYYKNSEGKTTPQKSTLNFYFI